MSKKDGILTEICKFLSQLISPGQNNSHDIAIFHVSSLASVSNQNSKFSVWESKADDPKSDTVAQ